MRLVNGAAFPGTGAVGGAALTGRADCIGVDGRVVDPGDDRQVAGNKRSARISSPRFMARSYFLSS